MNNSNLNETALEYINTIFPKFIIKDFKDIEGMKDIISALMYRCFIQGYKLKLENDNRN